ncbi:hypothetical protein CSPHI_02840 [Corynebacterium sphenisci DSM 44792]|uniref:endopeptidase La n=1 Tax=Corynebacterium sphenisci DSM 44792 TaxID=1437874 RepID=A0A1L7CWG8_9CORY|nr:PDZ domain-containing protein [Corynebacterium sphenisci]APT90184.1 hypothetical protein CSPHI_02840 [Corynebacterium sphenisci DSM 44792]
MNRRIRTLVAGAVPIVALGALLASPAAIVPFAAEGPGPVFDVLGEVEGAPAIEISGTAEDDPSAGRLDMTTVAVSHNLPLSRAIGMWADPDQQIVPIEVVFPPGLSTEEVERRNEVMFADSEANATAAALRALGRPVQVAVARVLDDGPAAGVLEEGDVVLAVDGVGVTGPRELQDAVGAHAPGEEVTLRVARDGAERELAVRLGEHPEDPARGHLGVGIAARPGEGVRVDYNVSGIGGPSAGLIMTLALVDKLSPGDLTGGRHIAGTGTIDGIGTVGEIGGITHKIAAAREAGAELFLVPEANCAEALTADAGRMPLVRVRDLDGALAALADPAAAPRCGA